MRTTILSIQKMKAERQRIPMITAYDAAMARLVEEAGIPMILVGDSLGTTVQGHETTIPVTLEDMIYHTRMVARGTSKALIILDLPFMTYTVSVEQALTNAARAIQEGGAGAVKMEGGEHIGLTAQSVYQLGGWRIQGRDVNSARHLIDDALALQEAGAFAIVLETIPAELGKDISSRLHIPTIGIGAGPDCDGQVQVFHDMLGLLEGKTPKHAKQYAHLNETIKQAVSSYVAEVRDGSFPTEANSFAMDEATLAELYGH